MENMFMMSIIVFFLLVSVFSIIIIVVVRRMERGKQLDMALSGIDVTPQFEDIGDKMNIALKVFMLSGNIVYAISGVLAIITYFMATVKFSIVLLDAYPYIPIGAAVFVFLAVPFFVKMFLRMRNEKEINRTLPYIVDLFCICLESGLSFVASIAKVLTLFDKRRNYLADNLRILLYELNAGANKKKALYGLVERTGNNAAIRFFISSIVQAESMGTSILDTLNAQAVDLREMRRQDAKEKIAKMSVKIVFPLVFCCMPIVIYMLLGPAFLDLMKAF